MAQIATILQHNDCCEYFDIENSEQWFEDEDTVLISEKSTINLLSSALKDYTVMWNKRTQCFLEKTQSNHKEKVTTCNYKAVM